MRKTVFSLCFTLLTTLSFAFEKDFGHLSISDGLSQMSVVSIAQDTDGYMWFGTRDGLNRYDGKEFKIFRNDIEDTLSISDNYIKVLIKDPKGGLWIGTAGGLNYYDSISESFTRFFINPGQRTGNINEINSLCLLEENLLIGTYQGLYILRDNVIEKFPDFFCISLPPV